MEMKSNQNSMNIYPYHIIAAVQGSQLLIPPVSIPKFGVSARGVNVGNTIANTISFLIKKC